MVEVTLFHYRDRNTFLNRANPLTKIACTLVLSTVMIKAGFLAILLQTLFLLIVAGFIQLPVRQYRHELRFFAVMGSIIAVSQYLSQNDVLVAVVATIRFFDIVLLGALFADTTAPDDLARSLGALLARIPKVRGQRIAATIELTLNTVPMLFDVSNQVREARICRLEPLWRHPIHRMVSYGSSISTMLLERAEDLAAALEAREYDVDAKRDTLPLRPYDAVVLGVTLVLNLPLLLFR